MNDQGPFPSGGAPKDVFRTNHRIAALPLEKNKERRESSIYDGDPQKTFVGVELVHSILRSRPPTLHPYARKLLVTAE